MLKHDFDYWGVDEMMLEPCCALKYYPEMEVCSKEQEGERRAKRKMQVRISSSDGDQRQTRALLCNEVHAFMLFLEVSLSLSLSERSELRLLSLLCCNLLQAESYIKGGGGKKTGKFL